MINDIFACDGHGHEDDLYQDGTLNMFCENNLKTFVRRWNFLLSFSVATFSLAHQFRSVCCCCCRCCCCLLRFHQVVCQFSASNTKYAWKSQRRQFYRWVVKWNVPCGVSNLFSVHKHNALHRRSVISYDAMLISTDTFADSRNCRNVAHFWTFYTKYATNVKKMDEG